MTAEEEVFFGVKFLFSFFEVIVDFLFSFLVACQLINQNFCSTPPPPHSRQNYMDARHAGEMSAMRAIVLVSFSFVSRMEFYKNCKCLIMTVWRREAKNENGKFYYKLMKVGEQRASTHHHHPSASPEKFQIYYVLGRKEIFTKKKKQREREIHISEESWRWWNLHLKGKKRIFDGMKKTFLCSRNDVSCVSSLSATDEHHHREIEKLL